MNTDGNEVRLAEDEEDSGCSLTAWSPHYILREVADGDEHSWPVELRWLWENHAEKLTARIADILRHGIDEPIEVWMNPVTGWKRMADGHHRVAAALALNLERIPVMVRPCADESPSTGDDDIAEGNSTAVIG